MNKGRITALLKFIVKQKLFSFMNNVHLFVHRSLWAGAFYTRYANNNILFVS